MTRQLASLSYTRIVVSAAVRSFFVCTLIGSVLSYCSPVTAAIVTSGTLSPSYPGSNPDPWNVGSPLSVSDGSLIVDDGSVVNSTNGHVNDLGSVSLSGGGKWAMSGTLFVTGNLDIQGGADVMTTDNGQIGSFISGDSGHVTVTGVGSTWDLGDDLSLPSGSLVITEGGSVSTGDETRIGDAATLTVGNNNSMLTSTDKIRIGSDGSLVVLNGGVVNANGGVILSGDTGITLVGGTLNTTSIEGSGLHTFPSGFGTMNQTGLVVINSSSETIPSGLEVNVSNSVLVVGGGQLTILGTLNSDDITLSSGTSLVMVSTALDQPVIAPVGSTIDIIGTVTFNDLVSGAGDFFGSGTAVFNGGYGPGDSPAIVPVENNIVFGSINTLSIELGGDVAGEFDQLDIGGDATLDGLLDVSLLGGFEPEAGDEFLFLDIAGNRNGEFAGLAEGDVVGNFAGIDLMITYAAGDGNDVALFAAAGSSGSAGVPEPSSLLLLSLGALGLSRIRRRRLRA